MKYAPTLVFAASVAILSSCDSKLSVNENPSPLESAGNNSDPRKSNYRPPSAFGSAGRDLKIAAIKAANSKNPEYTAARAAATVPTVAVLADPPLGTYNYQGYSYMPAGMFRVFLHTEANDNADHIRSQGLWEAIGGSPAVSTRTSYGLVYNYESVSYVADQLTGIPGFRYIGQKAPTNNPNDNNRPVRSWIFDNSPTQGIGLWFVPFTMPTLPHLATDYIVLRLSDSCPDGGHPFSQYFDDEDTNNQDIADRSIYPGFSGGDTKLAFCFVPKQENFVPNPSLTFSNFFTVLYYRTVNGQMIYGPQRSVGVFANPNTNEKTVNQSYEILNTNTILVDGEDTNFIGYIDWETLPSQYMSRVNNIMLVSSAAQTPFMSVMKYSSTAVGILLPRD